LTDSRGCRGHQGKLTARPERRFYFALAERLGIPVGEMLRRMDSRELSEWMAYYEWRDAPPSPLATAPQSAEAHAAALKAALFKGK
jgi:hypothetical protein